jgi:hypothetical protein
MRRYVRDVQMHVAKLAMFGDYRLVNRMSHGTAHVGDR